ncbi:hypothetical protein ACF0H5_004551 [Mactra antiquata]
MAEEDVIHCAKTFDYSLVLKPKQIECFIYILSGRDVIVNLPVGYGKSLIYQLLPGIMKKKGRRKTVVLVVSPLNIIQEEQLKFLESRSVSACRLPYSDYDSKEDLSKIADGHFSVLFAHPEALLNTESGNLLLQDPSFIDKVAAVTIDECHIVEEWGAEFRTAFKKLKTLPAIFSGVPFIALSGTLTKHQLRTIPSTLGLLSPAIVQETPDRYNIYLSKILKIKGNDVCEVYEAIFKEECELLHKNPGNYPITLLFMPLFYISQAAAYLLHLFGPCDIKKSCYSVLYSRQEKAVIKATLEALHSPKSRIRLVLTSSVAGMGFDPPCIERVIHAKPPRNLSQYLQEIGRAGRRGQPSKAILYFNKKDVAKNLPGIQEDIVEYCYNEDKCLREMLLAPFGFMKSDNIASDKCCSYCSLQQTVKSQSLDC